MADTNISGGNAPSVSDSSDSSVSDRRYRQRAQSARDRRLTPRFTEEELAAIRAAAEAARMSVTGFCASAVLAVARRQQGDVGRSGRGPVGVDELAELQAQLFAARVALNRAGTNLNQAVAAFNSTRQVPVWLEHAVERITRTVAGVDTVVARIHRRLGAGR